MPGFWAFIANVRSILSWVVKVAALAPLLDVLVNVGPPWPEPTAAVAFFCATEAAVVFALSYEFLWRGRTTKTWFIRATLIACAVLLVGGDGMYLAAYSRYVVYLPDSQHRVVVGTKLKQDYDKQRRSDPELYTDKYLLEGQKGDPTVIWTTESITWVRLWLLASWLFSWACLLFALSAFVALQYHPSRRTRAPRGAANAGRKPRVGGAATHAAAGPGDSKDAGDKTPAGNAPPGGPGGSPPNPVQQ